MLKQTLAAGSLLVGGLATISPAAAFYQHGFELHVARTESLSDLNFYWHVKPLFNYDVFNVRVRTSAGGEKQFEIGPFRGEKCTHRDGVYFHGSGLRQGHISLKVHSMVRYCV
jgi:hypothetical protein